VDLALLAEVVASRSKCTGPRVVISPSPTDLFVPELTSFSQVGKHRHPLSNLSLNVTLKQSFWMGEGRCAGFTEAVRDALHLLDSLKTVNEEVGKVQTSAEQSLSQCGTQTVFLECGRRQVCGVHRGCPGCFAFAGRDVHSLTTVTWKHRLLSRQDPTKLESFLLGGGPGRSQ